MKKILAFISKINPRIMARHYHKELKKTEVKLLQIYLLEQTRKLSGGQPYISFEKLEPIIDRLQKYIKYIEQNFQLKN